MKYRNDVTILVTIIFAVTQMRVIAIKTYKIYTDWFFKNHLSPHVDIEEKYVIPVLGHEHELVKKVLSEHRRLKRLFEDTYGVSKNLSLIEEELEAHIRFEERTLFKEIQNIASPEVLEKIMEKHDGIDSEFIRQMVKMNSGSKP
ncbi:MAG TPA: hemerythrin domain-containing protein [Ohtaekwangia sp.]|nr:hemerythrin domain-containing protein [Ohtaekwangia sp.]